MGHFFSNCHFSILLPLYLLTRRLSKYLFAIYQPCIYNYLGQELSCSLYGWLLFQWHSLMSWKWQPMKWNTECVICVYKLLSLFKSLISTYVWTHAQIAMHKKSQWPFNLIQVESLFFAMIIYNDYEIQTESQTKGKNIHFFPCCTPT